MAASEALMKQFPDVDKFVLHKWERLFNSMFDHHKANDTMDWHDFYIVTKRVKDIYGADSEQMRYARSSLKALWDGLLQVGDKNKDKLISVNEWGVLLKSHDPATGGKWFEDYCSFLFQLFDVSADSLLDVAEYTDGMEAFGFDNADAHAAFKKFAVDAKGKPVHSIDFPTFKKLWNDYFYSKDTAAIGNYLFGVQNVV